MTTPLVLHLVLPQDPLDLQHLQDHQKNSFGVLDHHLPESPQRRLVMAHPRTTVAVAALQEPAAATTATTTEAPAVPNPAAQASTPKTKTPKPPKLSLIHI